MTALAQALKTAGYETPSEKLRRYALEALGKYPKLVTQRQDYVAEKLRGDLTWALLSETQPQWTKESVQYEAIAALLKRVENEIKAQRLSQDTDIQLGSVGQ